MTIPRNDPQFPDRPQSDGFWRLSELVRELDGESEAADQALFEKFVTSMGIPIEDLAYMAVQRVAMAGARAELEGLDLSEIDTLRDISYAAWMDAFTMGYHFRDRQIGHPTAVIIDGEHRRTDG